MKAKLKKILISFTTIQQRRSVRLRNRVFWWWLIKKKKLNIYDISQIKIVQDIREGPEPRSPPATMLCEIESLGRSISAKPNVVTFGVNYDGVFTREAQSFMHRLATIKYPAVEGCQNYLVTRANWIDHWVKAIQSGLVNTLARGMAQSYTDLAAQHAIARVETCRPLSPPPVPPVSYTHLRAHET